MKMFKNKSIKASAEAVKILETGAAMAQHQIQVHLALASKVDSVPSGYTYNGKTLQWEKVSPEVVPERGTP